MVKFIEGFDVGIDKTHVAFMTFSNEPTIQFDLNDEYDARLLNMFVRRAQHDGGLTYIDKALESANTEIFSVEKGWRENVTSVSIHK